MTSPAGRPPRRSTIRLRLTALYAGAFFVAGAILIALTYFYLRQSLDHRPGAGAQGLIQQFLGADAGRTFPLADRLLTAVNAQAEQDRRDTLRGMLIWSLVSLVAVGIAAGGIGWLLAGRALAPLNQITETARRVAGRSLHERIALEGPPDEIKDLADTFDAMLDRLDRAFDSQRRFVANASHELRTPLAINRTLVEVALDDPETPAATRRLGATLLQVNQRNERLIDGLLVLASTEQQLETHSRADLCEIARRAVTVADPRRTGIDVRMDLQPAYVAGDPALLDRLAQNLLDNAVRYNVREQGWIGVQVTNTNGWAHLTVENTGASISPAQVDALFEPFRRLSTGDRITDPRMPIHAQGAGLGLSIVRSVASAHGGSATAVARPTGGLAVTVALPLIQ